MCTQRFFYGDVPDPLRRYLNKDCVEKFIQHIKKKIKRLHAKFPQYLMTELTDVLKREHKAT